MYILIVGNNHLETERLANCVKAALPEIKVECCHFVHHFEWITDRLEKPGLIMSDHTCALRKPDRPDIALTVTYNEPKLFARTRKIPFIRYTRLGARGPVFRIRLAFLASALRAKQSKKSV